MQWKCANHFYREPIFENNICSKFKHGYLIHTWSDNYLNANVMNQTLQSSQKEVYLKLLYSPKYKKILFLLKGSMTAFNDLKLNNWTMIRTNSIVCLLQYDF